MSPNQSLGILMDGPELGHIRVQLWCFSISCRKYCGYLKQNYSTTILITDKSVFHQGKNQNIHWFQCLKHEDFLLFSVPYYCKFTTCWFWTLGRSKQAIWRCSHSQHMNIMTAGFRKDTVLCIAPGLFLWQGILFENVCWIYWYILCMFIFMWLFIVLAVCESST